MNSFVKEKLNQLTKLPSDRNATSISYNKASRLAKFVFKATTNIDIGEFIFISIKPAEGQSYSNLATKVTAMPIGSENININIPKSEYYTSTLP